MQDPRNLSNVPMHNGPFNLKEYILSRHWERATCWQSQHVAL